VALVALIPSAWLATRPSFVHRGQLDPREPVYTSNYLAARGYLLPWLVTEVPPDLEPVPLTRRILPLNLVMLYLITAIPLALVWGVTALVLRFIRT
jgi:hypothetical protein